MPTVRSSHTAGQARHVLLFDGHCQFCTARAKDLLALARPGAVEAIDFQQPGVLERFPSLTHEACMQAMQLVTPDGRVFQGFEAAVRALATRPVFHWFPLVYLTPGIKQLCDRFYRFLAMRRYRLMGRAYSRGGCEDGTCSLHGMH
jgi:predicted DCC family thiol-disulfide oxidoreductase YuxK